MKDRMLNDIAYNNVDFIPGGSEYPERWATEGQEFRAVEAALGRARLNHSYGPHPREALDIFHPQGRAEGLVVFVHGGYWLRFDRSHWSAFATGLTARGWAVAMPSYPLAPEMRIAGITRAVRRAVDAAAALVPGPVRLTGHSAGGHLVARMMTADTAPEARGRIAGVVPISPLGDLRPLLLTSMNDGLKLDEDEATAESPVLLANDVGAPVTVWVGAEERPAFLDQARWLAQAWDSPLRMAPGRHHFDVIDELRDPDSPLVEAILS